MNPFSYLRNVIGKMKPSRYIESEEEIVQQRENNQEQLKITASYRTSSSWGFLGYILFTLGFIGVSVGLILIFVPQFLSSLSSIERLAAIISGPMLIQLGLALQLIGAVFVIAGKVDCINQRIDASMCYQDVLLERITWQNDMMITELRQIRLGTPLQGKHSSRNNPDNLQSLDNC